MGHAKTPSADSSRNKFGWYELNFLAEDAIAFWYENKMITL